MPLAKRLNVVDVALVVILAAGVAVGVAGYRRFHVPVPEISAVTPARVTAGRARPLSVFGRHLHPYLHVFVFESGHAPPINAIDSRAQEARALTTTPSQIDLTLPAVTAGVYDLYLFDEFQQVAVVPRAFVVAAHDHARANMTATVRVFVNAASARLLSLGDRDRANTDATAPQSQDAVVTAVRVAATAQPLLEMRVASAAPGNGAIWMGSRGQQVQVDLDLQVPLTQDAPEEWRYKGAAVRAGQYFDIETGRFSARGMVISVTDPQPAGAPGTHQ